jgi:hypothetical protein
MVRRVEVYLHPNGFVERRRVEPLQIGGEHREQVFRPRPVLLMAYVRNLTIQFLRPPAGRTET